MCSLWDSCRGTGGLDKDWVSVREALGREAHQGVLLRLWTGQYPLRVQQKVDACCLHSQDTGKDPISGADASLDDLVAVKSNHVSIATALAV